MPKHPLLNGEVWARLPNFPRYEISNKGGLYSTITDRLLTPSIFVVSSECFFFKAQLTIYDSEGKHQTFINVQKLAWQTFVGEVGSGFKVCLKIGTTDWSVDNLELRKKFKGVSKPHAPLIKLDPTITPFIGRAEYSVTNGINRTEDRIWASDQVRKHGVIR